MLLSTEDKETAALFATVRARKSNEVRMMLCGVSVDLNCDITAALYSVPQAITGADPVAHTSLHQIDLRDTMSHKVRSTAVSEWKRLSWKKLSEVA